VHCLVQGRKNVVGILPGLRAGQPKNRCVDSCHWKNIFLLPTASKPTLESTQPSIHCVLFDTWIKHTRSEAEHSPGTKVNYELSYIAFITCTGTLLSLWWVVYHGNTILSWSKNYHKNGARIFTLIFIEDRHQTVRWASLWPWQIRPSAMLFVTLANVPDFQSTVL